MVDYHKGTLEGKVMLDTHYYEQGQSLLPRPLETVLTLVAPGNVHPFLEIIPSNRLD